MSPASGRLELHEINFIGLVLSRLAGPRRTCSLGVTLLSQKSRPGNHVLRGFLRMNPCPEGGVAEMPQAPLNRSIRSHGRSGQQHDRRDVAAIVGFFVSDRPAIAEIAIRIAKRVVGERVRLSNPEPAELAEGVTF
jgi:hypothetical protein